MNLFLLVFLIRSDRGGKALIKIVHTIQMATNQDGKLSK